MTGENVVNLGQVLMVHPKSGKESLFNKFGLKTKQGFAYIFVPTDELTHIGISTPPVKIVIWFEFKQEIPVELRKKFLDTLLKGIFDAAPYVLIEKQARQYVKESPKTLLESSNEKKSVFKEILKQLGKDIPGVILTLFGVAGLVMTLWVGGVAKIEKYKATKLEKKIDKEIFEPTRNYDSAFEAYNFLTTTIKLLLSPTSTRYGLIVFGPPGTGKTFVVRRALYLNNEDYILLKGSETDLVSFFHALYTNRKKTVVLDDFDTFLKDPKAINFMKSLVDSYPVRTVSIIRYVQPSRGNDISSVLPDLPDKFQFSGKVIIITNLDRREIDPAILSRCYQVEINFDGKKMVEIIEKMLNFMHPHVPYSLKKEVFDFVANIVLTSKDPIRLDFRAMLSAIDLATAYPHNWKELVKEMLYSLRERS